MVMERDDAERSLGRTAHGRLDPPEPLLGERAALLAPRPHRAGADDVEALRCVQGLGRPEDPLPLRVGPREARGERVRDVVVPGHREDRPNAEAPELRRRLLELAAAAAVREIARRQQELGLDPGRQVAEGGECLGRLAAADVQVGDVENAGGHSRGRLYTRTVATESPELFDDIYLGLQAGGAVRKQRRGEPLSAEEEEVIGRWSRLSLWRKFIAIGAFALGTFGLGFTVGGLIFGRWRAARR